MAEKRRQKNRQPDKKVRDFFILTFPTILIIIVSMLFPVNQSLSFAIVEIALAIYQFVMLKQFLDNYYGIV